MVIATLALAGGCVSAASPAVQRTDTARPTAAPITRWVVTAALPRQQISRSSVGLGPGAPGWLTLIDRYRRTQTLFYPLVPDPEDPDLLIVDSPLSDERVMAQNGRFLGVLAEHCDQTVTPDECVATFTLAVSGDGPTEPERSSFRSVELTMRVSADTSCGPATPRAFTVERSRCPGAELGGRGDCPAEAARDGGYWIGPFRVLLAAWVARCGR